MIDPCLEAKLKKLLALAERGVGGEKDTAARMLAKLLEKHGLSLDDLTGEAASLYWFPVRGDYEKRLFCQILAMVTNDRTPETYTEKSARGKVGIMVNPGQAIEFDLHFNVLRKALAENLDIAFSAFVQANRIFPQSDSGGRGEISERDRKVLLMAGAIEPTPVHRQLTVDAQ